MDQNKQINIYNTLKKLFSHVSIKRKIQFLSLIFLTLICAFSEMITIGAAFPLIKIITTPSKILSEDFIFNILEFLNVTTDQQLIIVACSIFAILAIVTGLMRILLTYVNLRWSMAVSSDLFLIVYTNILNYPYSYHISHNSNEILSLITNKVSNITGAFLNCIIIFTSSLILFSIISILFIIDKWSTIYATLFFFFSYFSIMRLTKTRLIKNSKLISIQQDLVIKAIQEGLGGIRDIIIDKTQKYFINIYSSAISKVLKAVSQNTFIAQSPRYVLESIALVFICIIIIILTNQKNNNIYDILPVLGSLALGAQRILPLVNQVYQAHSANRGIAYSLVDVIKILEKRHYLLNTKSNINFSFNKSIFLKNLKFSYKNNNRYVFQSINFEILKGSKVAITGPSGSGKSTLLDLIMGLIEPTEGEITVDNFSIKNNKDQWQKKIAHVPQFIYLADVTIAENIAFGIPKNKIDLAKVIKASKQAQIHDFIDSRELGYNEIVGERGIKLSGGQRQRLGIARALYKEAELLILDEATSSLDNETEDSFIEIIDNLDKNITVLIVAHRLSSIKNCKYFIRL
jgi:ATP-binding cassette, subfamily B, bacterial PglK